MSPTLLLIIGASGWVGYLVLGQRRGSGQLNRLSGGQQTSFAGELSRFFNGFAGKFAKQQSNQLTISAQISKKEKDRQKKLKGAGLESAQAQAKYMIFKTVSLIGFPLLGSVAYLHLQLYYANLLMVFATGSGLLLPMFWLSTRTKKRTEDIQRELPLVLDLTNLGTSAGWDVASSLERVVDALYPEFQDHPLIKELKRARWKAASGYTWEESLEGVAQKLNNDTVRRTTLALSQAIKQGGDRSKQLESIAQDAQRIYYSELDRRLAALPAKALLVTMMLMFGFFGLLMTPVVTGIKESLGG